MKIEKAISSFCIVVICFCTMMFFHTTFCEITIHRGELAAFGATSILSFSNSNKKIFGLTNIVFGSLIGGLIGVLINHLNLPFEIAVLTAVGLSVFVMNYSKLSYPPGGALALIPLLTDNVSHSNYFFLLSPVLTGTIMIYIFTKIQEFINLKIEEKWRLKKQ